MNEKKISNMHDYHGLKKAYKLRKKNNVYNRYDAETISKLHLFLCPQKKRNRWL